MLRSRTHRPEHPRLSQVLRGLRAAVLGVGLLLPSALMAHAQADSGPPETDLPASDDFDQGAVARCQDTLNDVYGMSPDDPSYLDAITVCYAVETAADTHLDPLPLADINNGGACFAAGSVVKVSQSEIDELSQWGRDNGRPRDEIKGDIEALNRARGGSGSTICHTPPTVTPQNTGVKCDSNFDSIDDAIAWEQGRVKDTEAHLKALEQKLKIWELADFTTNWRVEFYVMDRILNDHNLALFDPVTPERKFAEIDRKYHKPRYGDFVSPDSMVLVDLSKAIPAWQASPDGQAAQAEKDAYAVFDADGNLIGGTYKAKMDSINSYRQLPRNPSDINNLGRPAEMLRQIRDQQDSDIVVLRRAQQDLNVWTQAKANGINCSFSTGPLGQPIFAPIPRADPLFVFVLRGIGLVIATERM